MRETGPKTTQRWKCLRKRPSGFSTSLKTTRRWEYLTKTLWGLLLAEYVSNKRNEPKDYSKEKMFQWEKHDQRLPEVERVWTREMSPKTTWRWWWFNDRDMSKDYSKAKVFLRTNGLPYCGLFRFLDLLNFGFKDLGRSPIGNVDTFGHNCAKTVSMLSYMRFWWIVHAWHLFRLSRGEISSFPCG